MSRTAFRRFFRHGQAGQSIIILAFGFLMLIAFVGIVTDVSLLFVRYSTLRRAVDASAVAAATQMRRVENDPNSPEGIDTGGSTNVANMNLAARQFLNLYGLNPSDVTVETCASQMVGFDPLTNQPIISGIVEDGKMVMSPEQQEKNYQALCKDGRKLVRVTASIKSPTVFLRLLGMQDITLTVGSVSETAVLDVVLALDVSESMADETTYADFETVLQHPVARILPGHVPRDLTSYEQENWWLSIMGGTLNLVDGVDPETASMPGKTEDEINADLLSGPVSVTLPTLYGNMTYRLQPRAVLPVYGVDGKPALDANGKEMFGEEIPFANWNSELSRILRADCRVRFWPFAHNIFFGSQNNMALLSEYRSLFFNNDQAAERAYFNIPGHISIPTDPTGSTSAEPYYRWAGWVPTFDYYGCCNDPNGDGNFTDLACQPMRSARDASSDFLRRIDFPRGDAVAILTFSQSAYIIRPLGPAVVDGKPTDPWIRGDQQLAEDIVSHAVGVRAEPVFYWDDPTSYTDASDAYPYEWDGFRVGSDVDTSEPIVGDYAYWNAYRNSTTKVRDLTSFPVRNNCPFDMAASRYPFNTNAEHRTNGSILYNMQLPSWLTASVLHFDELTVPRRSYDYRGSCRDTNIGGAILKTGSVYTELGQGRTEGSVWVMVLLSDGAAGASDPVTNQNVPTDKPVYLADGTTLFRRSDGSPTYQQRQTNPYVYGEAPDFIPVRGPNQRAQYGSFGVCPFGFSENQPGQLITSSTFPYCSDPDPNTRHTCASTLSGEQNPKNNPLYIDLGNNNQGGCAETYDVDDYARDWADYVAGVTQSNNATTQLPVMFTIGFGLTYPNTSYTSGNTTVTCSGPTDYACIRSANIESYLGEELLRYIADAGDNFRIDDDYWQHELDRLDVFDAPTDPDALASWYGQRGPCESADGTSVDTHDMLAPGVSCGNYFNAPGETELQQVFNEIASRMFTRLSQ